MCSDLVVIWNCHKLVLILFLWHLFSGAKGKRPKKESFNVLVCSEKFQHCCTAWDKVHLLMSPCSWDPALGHICFSGFRLSWLPASQADFCRESLCPSDFSASSHLCAISQLILNALKSSSCCLDVSPNYDFQKDVLPPNRFVGWVPKEETEQRHSVCWESRTLCISFSSVAVWTKWNMGLWEGGGGIWKG